MKKITKRDEQTVRFLKWIKSYPGWWYLICTPNDEHMSANMMYTLIKHLAQEQLYEIIFVLLMVHRNESFMKDFHHYLLLEIITENWNGKIKSREEIIKEMLQLLN